MEDKFSKLPVLAKPFSYDLYLKPCLKSFKCPGTTRIAVEVLEKTKYFTLHANKLEFESASLELANGKVLDNLSIQLDKKWNLLTVHFPIELEPKSQVKLNFKYSGEINNYMQGFSRSVYNGDKYMASTQFESTCARQVFPCWDEPIYKAVFNVNIEVDDTLTALSNMHVVEETKIDGGKKLVRFAPTPLMSTCLVAFAIGNFEYIETKTKRGILMRVYTTEGMKQHGKFSLDLSAKAIDFFEEWFGLSQPLKKIDLIAIPDFATGAMENWGLVTFREILLLVDPVNSTTLNKSQTALTVSHELAHFWFGNLVSMEWWTDLWLKEGFASFMEYLCVEKLCPEFKIFLSFVSDQITSAFSLDSLYNSHPIEVEIKNPNELDEIYDNITYSKSNAVIRMLYSYLGESKFQAGLRNYLNKFQYRNAVTVDLWNSLSEVTGEDIGTMMSGWTQQMGFPIVSVQQIIDDETRTLKLHQERFLADGGSDKANPQWQIPISVITASSPKTPIHKTLLKEKSGEIVLTGIKPGDWVKLNAELTGFYRVRYTGDMLESLIPAFKSKQLGAIDRFSLVNDIWALIRAGDSPISQFLQIFTACVDEDEYIVWSSLDQSIGSIQALLDYVEDSPKFKTKFNAFVCKIMEPLANRLGWDPIPNEDTQQSMLRGLVLGRLSKCDHQPTNEIALAKFNAHVNKGEKIVADLRRLIYSAAARTNKPEAIASLKRIYETVELNEIQVQVALAMAHNTDAKILADVFKYCIEDGKLRPQDIGIIFYGAKSSRVGKEYIWTYFKNNVKKLLDFYGTVNSSRFQQILGLSFDGNYSNAIADEALEFFKSNFDEESFNVFSRPLNQSIEVVRLNEKLLKANENDISAFLTTKY